MIASVVVVTLLSLSTGIPASCPTDEGYQYDITSGLCIIFLSEWKTRKDTKTYCEGRGDRLVRLDTTDKNNFFKAVAPGDSFWLSGFLSQSGEWRWSVNVTVCHTHWAEDQPDGTGKCMAAGSSTDYQWEDKYCNENNRVVCERVLENETAMTCSEAIITNNAPARLSCPTDEGYQYDVTSGLCVIILSKWINWGHSKALCDHRNDRLVRLDTEDKYKFFKNIAPQGVFWLGGYITSSYQWGWSEDVGLCYTMWATDQPDGSGECMAIGNYNGFLWDDIPCGDNQQVVCERVLENTTNAACPRQITKANNASTNSSCPTEAGYTYDVTSGLCVILSSGFVQWFDAQKRCTDRGDRLVWLDTAAKNIFFRSIVTKGNYWLGAYITPAGDWEWSESERLTYTEWPTGQPDGSGGCLAAGEWNGFHWDDTSCSEQKTAVCERAVAPQTATACSTQLTLLGNVQTTSSCPTGVGYIYDVTSGLCVILLTSWGQQAEVKASCEQRGDRLVWLDTVAKANFFKTIVTQDSFWLGGYRTGSLDWKWSADVSIVHSDWSGDQPDGSGDCMAVGDWSGYRWDDVPCTEIMRAVCERVVGTVQNTFGCSNNGTGTGGENTSDTAIVTNTTRETSNITTGYNVPPATVISPYISQDSSHQPSVYTQLEGIATSSSVQFPQRTSLDTSHQSPVLTRHGVSLSASVALHFPQPTIQDTPNQPPLQTQHGVSLSATEVFTSAHSSQPQPYASLQTDINPSTTSTTPSSTTVCGCFCDSIHLSSSDLERIQSEIRESLLLDKKTLSKNLARYTSAPDERRSSVGIGSAGIAFLVVVVLLIFIGDLQHAVLLFSTKREKYIPYRHHSRQV